MADEELSVGLVVEGFEDFTAAFKDMEKRLGDAADALDELSGTSKKTGTALDGVSDAYDKNAARANKLYLAQVQLTDVQAKLATETNALTRAQLAVRADELKRQIEDLSKAEDTNIQSTQGMKLSLTDLKSGIDLVVGAFKTVKEVAVKAFEFTQEGAAINATKESFDRLGISIEDMRAASNNTIPDMQLMRSTLTLMAGSSGEVADAFSGAMPQLLQMAKAANKLNPTLGDTDFMLQSITTAAKRQSMQIADNLGIIVKQGDAYEKYAKSIGVAVSELTNEQKQIAFLNGLLEAGNVLIEQAGGTAESTGDAWAQLTTEIKNATDAMKANAAEGVRPLVQGLADMMKQVNEANRAAEIGVKIFGNDYREAMAMAARGSEDAAEKVAAMDYAIQAMDTVVGDAGVSVRMLDGSAREASNTFSDAGIKVAMMSENQIQATQSGQELAAAQLAAANASATAAIAFNNSAAALSEMGIAAYVSAQLAVLKASLDAGTISTQDYANAQEALLTQFGLLTPAEQAAQGALDSLRASAESGKISWEAYALAAQNVKRSLDEIPREIGITIRYDDPGFTRPSVTGGEGATAYQHGGTTPGGAFLVGEHGPELITGMRGGSRVMSAPTTARMLSQNSVTNNYYNLTTNSLTRPGGLALEFAAMEMGSR